MPAIVVAGTHSGCGKTTVTLALLAALVRRGLRVQGFKVGPDFIDPGHQTRLTGRPSRNLDTWLFDPASLARTYRRATIGADVAVVEGVMGLFDGRGATDEAGSTADLARCWGLPVVLTVDARGSPFPRSIAPLVLGFARFDRGTELAAVVANRVGSRRHYEGYLRPALGLVPEVEPLGYLLRDDRVAIPSRNLGLETAEDRRPVPRTCLRASRSVQQIPLLQPVPIAFKIASFAAQHLRRNTPSRAFLRLAIVGFPVRYKHGEGKARHVARSSCRCGGTR